MESHFEGFSVKKIARTQNDEADTLARAASQGTPLPPEVFFEVLKAPSFELHERVVVPVTAAEVELLEEKHVLAVDGSSVDRAVIAKILRSSKYRGEPSHPFQPNFQRV